MYKRQAIFYFGKDRYLHGIQGEKLGDTPAGSAAVGRLFWLLPVLLVVFVGLLYFDVNVYPILLWLPLLGGIGSLVFILMDKSLSAREKQQVIVIYVVSFFVIFFWATFEQAGASLTFFADEQVNRQLFGWTIPPALFQNFNPFFVVTMAPVMAALWTWLGNRGLEPASPYKMALGLALLAVGYAIMLPAVTHITPGVKVSAGYLAALYFFHSVGELCLSPIGLSLVNRLAPAKYSSLLMAVWFLANVVANKLAGVLSGYYPEAGKVTSFLGYQMHNLSDFFLLFIVMSGVAAVLLFLLSRRLARMM